MQLPPGTPFGPAEDQDRRMLIAGRSLEELPDETAVARIGTESVNRARILAEGMLFGLLAIALTWPLAAHFTTHATGSNSWDGTTIFFETPVNIWNLWWFRYALIELGQSPFDGSYIFYPHGADLWFHTVAPFPALVGTILQTFLSVVATYNTLVVVSFIAAGVCAAALARELGVTPRAATLAGAIYAFSPVVVGHLYAGHFELLWTFWIPATVLAFLRLIGQPGDHGWIRAAVLGMMVAAAAYTCNYYAVYAVEAMAVTAVVRWRELLQGRVVRRLVLAAIVAIAGVAPMAVRFVSAESVLGSTADVSADFRDLSIEPLAFFVPSFTHPLFSATFKDCSTSSTEVGASRRKLRAILAFLSLHSSGSRSSAGAAETIEQDVHLSSVVVSHSQSPRPFSCCRWVRSSRSAATPLVCRCRRRFLPTCRSCAWREPRDVTWSLQCWGWRSLQARAGIGLRVAGGEPHWRRRSRSSTGPAFRSSPRQFPPCITDSPVNLVRSP